MKKRISVYIDEGIWELAKVEARRLSVEVNSDISASEVVEDAIKAFIGKEPRKELKIKTVVSDSVPGGEAHFIDDSGKKVGEIKNLDTGKSEAQILAEGQAKLDATRKNQNIKMDKIVKTKAKIESLTGHSGPRPKGGK